MSTKADRVIICMADYLGLGEDGRINEPSTTGKNWTWRMNDKYASKKLRESIKELTAMRPEVK